MPVLSSIRDAVLHLIFPHVCEGCGSDVLQSDHFLCLECHSKLPVTEFAQYSSNPIEKIFWGRLPLASATAHCYFTKNSTLQNLLHVLKYRGNRELGLYLGRVMGTALAASNRFRFVDALVPLPLFPAKERARGYNQAAVLCEGIAEVMDKPILKNAVIRTTYTDSQTKKNRVERWANMEGRFELSRPEMVRDMHLLLVDDVVTTGATLEACGTELLKGENTRLSLATLCYSAH